MRLIWLVVFVLLLLSQLLGWLTGRIAVPGIQPLAGGSADDLERVADHTRAFWSEVMESLPPATRDPGQVTPVNVFEREQLMLRLRDAEAVLTAPDSRVRISSELEAWIQGSSGRDRSESDPSGIVPYMAGLLDWLESFPAKDDRIAMERSFIAPESTSDFPCLVFELSGPAVGLGEFLLAFEARQHRWILKEIDLNHGEGSRWWLRGSFAFGGDGW